LFHHYLSFVEVAMSRSLEFICPLCSKGRIKKGHEKKWVYLPSMLYHMARKQKAQLMQYFPFFSANGLKAHPVCTKRFRRFAQHHQEMP
jgi:hypothetical protein